MLPRVQEAIELFRSCGGVVDYVFVENLRAATDDELHRQAALRGMQTLDERLEKFANERATPTVPASKYFRLKWDARQLTGSPTDLDTFWGNDSVIPRAIGPNAWSIPTVNGYKRAFFLPPLGLACGFDRLEEFFRPINDYVLGGDLAALEIYSWSTNWSNYFDAGREWWGAFYWTVRRKDIGRITVIGASASD